MSLQRVQRLWFEGYSILQIAKKTKMSPSSIYTHIRQGTLVLPERPWATARELGVWPGTVTHWASKGWVRRSPSGRFHVDDVKAVAERLSTRQCQHPGCPEVIESLHPRWQFCSKHRRYEGLRRGVSVQRLLTYVGEHPGIYASELCRGIGGYQPAVGPLLVDLERQGLLQVEYLGNRRRRFYLAERQAAAI